MSDKQEFKLLLEKTKPLRQSFGDDLMLNSDKTLQYFSKLIELADTGKIDQRGACYLIADTMWYPSIDKNPGLEAIVGDAGELELPDEHIDGDRTQRWERLKTWIHDESESTKNTTLL